MDEEMLQDFWTRHRVQGTGIAEDGEGNASVGRSMSDKFDLLMVGRRGGAGSDDGDQEGSSSALTSGLSEWSECAELGVLGDMLASEFASKVSILVIQQQPPKNATASNSNNY